jgi:hypothetical protein
VLLRSWAKDLLARLIARWPLGDLAISLSGVAFACASATFAAVMIAQSHQGGYVKPSEHLAIFSRPLSQPYTGAKEMITPYDPMPVGTVRARPRQDDVTATIPKEKIVANYKLRRVMKDEALVQGPEGFVSLRAGMSLADVGEVLAIEMRGRRFVIVTSAGLIIEDE